MASVKRILENEIKLNEVFWKMIFDVSCEISNIDSLYNFISDLIISNNFYEIKDIEIKQSTINCHKLFLDKIKEFKSNGLNIRKLEDEIRDDIHKMRFELRDINDAKKGIKRKPFYPEKLIGKKFSLKPYGTKNIEVFEINSIKSHSYYEYDDSEMVVYDVGNQRENGFPMFRQTIETLINYGRLIINPLETNPKYTVQYKIL